MPERRLSEEYAGTGPDLGRESNLARRLPETQRFLDLRTGRAVLSKVHAGVAKLVYAPDSKSGGLNAHVGSSPTSVNNLPFEQKLLAN